MFPGNEANYLRAQVEGGNSCAGCVEESACALATECGAASRPPAAARVQRACSHARAPARPPRPADRAHRGDDGGVPGGAVCGERGRRPGQGRGVGAAARQGDGGARKLGAQVGARARLPAARCPADRCCMRGVPAAGLRTRGGAPAALARGRRRYPHLKEQGRCAVHRREPPEDEEEAFEPTPEEAEEGPEPLAPAEGDADVLGGPAWTPLLSSAGEHVKYQVAGERGGGGRPARCAGLHAHGAGQVKQAPARYGVPARAHVYTPTHRRARARRVAQQPVAGRVLRMPGGALHQHLRRLGRQERGVCAAAAAAGGHGVQHGAGGEQGAAAQAGAARRGRRARGGVVGCREGKVSYTLPSLLSAAPSNKARGVQKAPGGGRYKLCAAGGRAARRACVLRAGRAHCARDQQPHRRPAGAAATTKN